MEGRKFHPCAYIAMLTFFCDARLTGSVLLSLSGEVTSLYQFKVLLLHQ
jgi:hypothetical protein